MSFSLPRDKEVPIQMFLDLKVIFIITILLIFFQAWTRVALDLYSDLSSCWSVALARLQGRLSNDQSKFV